jgi:YVTN family beta-propeller protein
MRKSFMKAAFVAALAIAASVANGQSVKSVIQLPGLPDGVAVNYLTNKIYVTLPSFGGSSDSIAIIDGKSDTIASSISVPPVAQQIAVDDLRNIIYVGGFYFDVNGVQQDEVVAANGKTNKVASVIPISSTAGLGIQGLAVNLATGTVYVANASDNVIDVIDCGSSSVSKRIPVSSSPLGVAANSLNNQVYAAIANGTVNVIDGSKNVITTTTAVGGANAGVAANIVTGNVFVTNNTFGPSTTAILDSKGNILADLGVGNTPLGVDVDPVTNLAFVANTQDGTVSIINGKKNTVSASLPVSSYLLAVNPFTEKVYVSGQGNFVTVISEK